MFKDTTREMGRAVLGPLEYTAEVFFMIYRSCRAAIVDNQQGFRTVFGVISSQIYFTGWQALPLISVLALASGSVVILQSATQLAFFGGESMVGNLMIMIIFREVAPLLTALIVIARSGTAVASEIGSMRVHREIEALEVMGIDPLSFIVFPRLVGGIISVLCLAFYYVVIAIIGGFFLTRLVNDLPFSFYTDSLAAAFTKEDVFIFVIKNCFSGAIIFTNSCHQGLLVKLSPHEIPQATTRAVVNSVIYVVIFNLLLTALFYIDQLMQMGVI
jgi:phospholipid/cholesterol/gamma-HCH transport system permease protein